MGRGGGREGGREAVGATLVILIMGFVSQRLLSGQNRFNIDSDACKPPINKESKLTQHENMRGR